MEQPGAYGAGMAGGSFNPIAFIKKPSVIIRIFSWLFAVVVFSCITAGGKYHHLCMFNRDPNACRYGIGIGVLAFLICMGFLILDALFDQLSSVQHRKYVVIADMASSGLWTFLWFVGFCYLTDSWRHTSDSNLPSYDRTRYKNNCQAAIAFSFFSIFTWAALTVLAVMKYRQGISEAFSPSGYEPDPTNNPPSASPYNSYPGDIGSEPYQQPPFSSEVKQEPNSDYQPPTY